MYQWHLFSSAIELCTGGVSVTTRSYALDDVNAYLDRPGAEGSPDCKLNFETMSRTRFMNVHTVDKLQSKTKHTCTECALYDSYM